LVLTYSKVKDGGLNFKSIVIRNNGTEFYVDDGPKLTDITSLVKNYSRKIEMPVISPHYVEAMKTEPGNGSVHRYFFPNYETYDPKGAYGDMHAHGGDAHAAHKPSNYGSLHPHAGDPHKAVAAGGPEYGLIDPSLTAHGAGKVYQSFTGKPGASASAAASSSGGGNKVYDNMPKKH